MLRQLTVWIGLCLLGFTGSAALVGCTHQASQAARLDTRLPSGFGFYYLDEGASVKLAYGEPNSDNVGLMLQCAKGSRSIEVSDAVRSSASPILVLVAAGQRSDLQAKVQPGEGQPIVVARAPSSARAMVGFRKSGRMEVAYGGLRYGMVARAQERASVERFFHACEGRPA